MGDDSYKVVFQGRIQDGFSVDAVKSDFVKLFKTSQEKTEKMFSGRAIVLQSSLSHEKALRYEKAIRKIGAECLVLKDQAGAIAVKSAKKAAGDLPKPSSNGLLPASSRKKNPSTVLESYRPHCGPPPCYLVPDIPERLLGEISDLWNTTDESEELLAWFEVVRHPNKVYGMLLTDKHLHVRSLTSGKRSIPIAEIGKIKIVEKGKAWELVFGASNLYRNLPKKLHESLEQFLSLCFEVAGLAPKVKKRTIAGKKETPASDAGMGVAITIGALVMIGINMELLLSAGGGIIMSFLFGFVLILLTPTVIGLIIGAWFIGQIADLPTFALVLRTLTAVLVGSIVTLLITLPMGAVKGDGKKSENDAAPKNKSKSNKKKE